MMLETQQASDAHMSSMADRTTSRGQEYGGICVEHVGDIIQFSFDDDKAHMHQAECTTLITFRSM